MTLAALVTRDRLLTLGMLVLCAVAAFLLVRSDVVEGILARFKQFRKKPEHDFAPYPKPAHDAHLVDDEPLPMLPHESLSSDSSELSDAADDPVVKVDVPVVATVCAPRAPQKRAPRKPRVRKSSSSSS